MTKNKISSSPTLLSVLALLLLAAPFLPALGDDQPAQKTETTVMYLGKVPITGDRNIFLTLQSIKVALQRPFSTKAEDANLVVCRINRAQAEALEYLDCDFNGDYTRQRDESQLAAITAQSRGNQAVGDYSGDPILAANTLMLQDLITIQPNHRLHIPINGGNLMKLLDSLPMPSPDQQDAPAPATSSGNPGL